MIKNIFSEY